MYKYILCVLLVIGVFISFPMLARSTPKDTVSLIQAIRGREDGWRWRPVRNAKSLPVILQSDSKVSVVSISLYGAPNMVRYQSTCYSLNWNEDAYKANKTNCEYSQYQPFLYQDGELYFSPKYGKKVIYHGPPEQIVFNKVRDFFADIPDIADSNEHTNSTSGVVVAIIIILIFVYVGYRAITSKKFGSNSSVQTIRTKKVEDQNLADMQYINDHKVPVVQVALVPAIPSFTYAGLTIPKYGRMEKSLWTAYAKAIRKERYSSCNRPNSRCGGPIHTHHIIEVNRGGSNLPENMELLCASCHHYEHPWMWNKMVYRPC